MILTICFSIEMPLGVHVIELCVTRHLEKSTRKCHGNVFIYLFLANKHALGFT